MEASEYHALSAFSHGRIEDFIANPELYFGRYISKEIPQEDSTEMDIGSGLHLLVLEGQEKFDRTVSVWKGGMTKKGVATMSKNSDDYKSFLKEAQESHRLVLDQPDVDKIQAMANALYANESSRKLLFDWEGPTEHSLLWKQDGWDCKARLDKFIPKRNLPLDLKSTYAMSFDAVVAQAYKLGYHRKDAWYRKGCMACNGSAPEDFIFVSVRNDPPYSVWTWSFDAEVAIVGEIEVDRAMRQIIERMASGRWEPKESVGVQTAHVPSYKYSKEVLEELERRKDAYAT